MITWADMQKSYDDQQEFKERTIYDSKKNR